MEYLVLACVATMAAGIIRTSVGVGAGIGLTASLLLLFDPQTTLAIMVFLQIVFGVSAVAHYWRQWDSDLALRLLLPAVAGVVVATALINVLPLEWVRRTLGVCIVFFGCLELFRLRLESSPTAASVPQDLGAGFAAGVAGGLVNASGAVLGLFLKRRRLDHKVYLGTLSVVIMGHDVSRLAIYWGFGMLSFNALKIAALLTPFAFCGGWLGAHLQRRMSEKILSNIVLCLVILLGIILLK